MTYFKLGKKLHNFSHLRIAYILYLYFLTQDEINFDIQTDIVHSDYDKKSLSVTDYCKMVAKCVDYKISIIKDYDWDEKSKNIYINGLHQVIHDLKKFKKRGNVTRNLVNDSFSKYVKEQRIKYGLKLIFINDFNEISFKEIPSRNSTRKAQKIVSSHKLIAQLKITTLKPCYVCGRNLLPREQIWECSCNFQFERVHSPGQDWI